MSVGGAPELAPDNRHRIDVELWLRVENNNKFVRGKTKARAWIEDSVLRPHAMRKPYANKNEYVLTLIYDQGLAPPHTSGLLERDCRRGRPVLQVPTITKRETLPVV